MPAQNLLDINANAVFEAHTILEIEDIRKKLHAEIERKREELRTMVGERYRDLIEAADTISDMKLTAEGIISHIDKMSSKCQHLQQRHLLGFKLDPSNGKSERFSMNKVYHSIAIQIKILMTIPEQIWSAVEREDYLQGAQLFLFARHINTGLQLNVGGDIDVTASQVATWFPVISRQWSAISHFRPAILAGSESKLQRHDLTPEGASNCLCSLVLLEGLNSLELLNKLLSLRTQALEQTLKTDQHVSVKARISTSLRLLVHTLHLLHACFLDGCQDSAVTEGMVWHYLKRILGRDAPPSVTLVDLKDTIGTKFLPSVVQEFRPSTREPVVPVAPSAMRESLARWLDAVRTFTHHEAGALLQLVGSVRGLQAVRTEAGTMGMPDHWDDMCQRLMVPRSLDLWDSCFQTLLTVRAKQLVSQQWDAALAQLKETLDTAVDQASRDNCSQPEHDLRWFVWKERVGDLPQSKPQEQQNRGLLLKAKGYSPCVERLCHELDSQLGALLHDLQHYVGDAEPGATPVTDRDELQEHLQVASRECVQELIGHIQRLCTSEVVSQRERGEACVILMARFLQAVCELCPNLHKCLALSLHNKSSPWQELCIVLRQESLAAWQLWSASIYQRLNVMVTSILGQPLPLALLLHSVPQWDIVSIEEEGEEGRSIRSNIRVPSQPSLPLQSLLSQACQELNAIAPHTLPRKIHQELVERLVGDILDSYMSVTNEGSLNQARALQHLLDVKFLTMLLVSRDSKVLMSKSQEICDKLEDKIDPFDLDVFCPYVQNNIKRSVQKTQCLLGVLIAWPDKLAVVSGLRAAPTASNAVEDPSVLPLCTGAPWFPLLPVTGPRTPITLQHLVDKPQRKKATSPKPKGEQTPGEIVRSGAAAFFGVMSSDWFGSG